MKPMRVAAIVLVATVAACSSVAPATTAPGSALTIDTAPAHSSPPGVITACAAAGLLPVIVSRQGDALILLNATSRQPVAVIWPHGFTARLVNGKGELLDPSGTVVAVEGDTLSDIAGGIGADPVFGVCSVGGRTYP